MCLVCRLVIWKSKGIIWNFALLLRSAWYSSTLSRAEYLKLGRWFPFLDYVISYTTDFIPYYKHLPHIVVCLPPVDFSFRYNAARLPVWHQTEQPTYSPLAATLFCIVIGVRERRCTWWIWLTISDRTRNLKQANYHTPPVGSHPTTHSLPCEYQNGK